MEIGLRVGDGEWRLWRLIRWGIVEYYGKISWREHLWNIGSGMEEVGVGSLVKVKVEYRKWDGDGRWP
ncbi:hypothetical protein VIGAN_05197500 [Vigna angularis var. angularis]|uniref:Uncharacterized protein n=1 Tax=Vigna angularis var. angularis TaxID=157739 RepID=A0A0S3S6P3_PHAAN|nr:hypothetical protein VIGAN_05197500 [Vigna angularis var. angularis]